MTPANLLVSFSHFLILLREGDGGGGGGRGSTLLGSHFSVHSRQRSSNFSSPLGSIFKILSMLTWSQLFHFFALGLSKWGIVSALGCQNEILCPP